MPIGRDMLLMDKPQSLADRDQRRMEEIFVSVVMPVRETAAFIAGYIDRMTKVMSGAFDHYEVITVDDGSADGTVATIKAAQRQVPRVTLLVLSQLGVARRSVADTAIIAGLDKAIGDFVVILDPRLDQPELIPQMVQATLEGADIVYALPEDRLTGNGLANIMANFFIRTIGRAKGIELPMAISSCRLLSRSALNFILKSADRHRILILAPAMSGYEHATISYKREYPGISGDPKVRHLAPSGGFRAAWRSVQRALDLVFAVSVTPLRAVSLLALIMSAVTLLYSIYVLGFWALSDSTEPGWVSLSLQISGLFFMMSLVLSVMSEYLLRTLENTGHRPLYFLTEQSQSDILFMEDTPNVLNAKNEK